MAGSRDGDFSPFKIVKNNYIMDIFTDLSVNVNPNVAW